MYYYMDKCGGTISVSYTSEVEKGWRLLSISDQLLLCQTCTSNESTNGTSNYFYEQKIRKPSLKSDFTINYLLKKHIYENENEKFGYELIDNRRLRRNEK